MLAMQNRCSVKSLFNVTSISPYAKRVASVTFGKCW
jgi:hypothetical protein